METSLKEPAACVDDALDSCRGSAVGWDSAVDYVQGADAPGAANYADPGVVLRGILPLPAAFTSQYNAVRYKSFMGLFPEINRAWLTVDERLFLWGYSAESLVGIETPHNTPGTFPGANRVDDFYSYEGFDQIIVSVGLVHPRNGVFVDEVEYLLAVATSVEVTLLGVTFSGPDKTGEICLVPTNISVATDNVLMLKISSTPDGRIFMAGADGSLHEFVYQGEHQRWMLGLLPTRPRKRVRKLVHNASSIAQYLLPASVTSYFSREDELVDLAVDPSRKALYTLSQGGNLTVYDMSDRDTLKNVRSVSVAHESRNLVSLSIPAAEREYVAIFAVPPNLSTSTHLIVVTSFGERIYFSTNSPSTFLRTPTGRDGGGKDMRPRSLQCVGYRPWPEGSSNGTTRPCIHMAWWNKGCLVMSDLRDKESDRLISVFPDSTTGGRNALVSARPTTQSVEIVFQTSASVSGDQSFSPAAQDNVPTRAFAIADVHELSSRTPPNFSLSLDKVPLDTPRYFWVLTSSAMHLYERVPPLSRLQEILSASGGSDSEIRAFFSRYGAAEVCAMCIKLAITNPALSAAAARVFYAYGGDPSGLQDPPTTFASGRAARRSSVSFPMEMDDGTPMNGRSGMVVSADRGSPPTISHFDVGRPAVQSTPVAKFSGAHDGTSLYIAQVVYPLWNEFITNCRDPDGYQSLAAPRQWIENVRDELLSLVAFLEKYAPEVMLPSLSGNKGMTPGAGIVRPEPAAPSQSYFSRATPMDVHRASGSDGSGNFQDKLYRGLFQLKKTGEARRAESASINSLKSLSLRCAEACSLVLVLAEHQLHRLAPSMPKDCRENLVRMRLCDLVAAEVGVVVSTALLESLFTTYADGASAVSTIGHILHQQCPSYFGDADIAMHRGLALLRQAVARVTEISESVPEGDGTAIMHDASLGLLDGAAGRASDRAEAVAWAEEAAQVLKSAPERLYDLPGVCADFEQIGTIPVLIDVALAAGNKAESMGDRERAKVAYTCVLDSLNPLIHESGDAGLILEDDDFSDARGRQNGDQSSNRRLKGASMRVALSSTSDMFLNSLYEFLLQSKNGEVELLQHPSPGVQRFLEEKQDSGLLWRYFARHGRHADAAVILMGLAEEDSDKVLVDRLNDLSCALHNAKTAASAGDPRAETLLSELSDLMDVAKVQLRVRDELTQHHAPTEDVTKALEALNGEILDLSKLFNKYARPFELIEASLEAFRCGSYRDDAYVRSLWMKLLHREAASSQHTPAILYQKLVAIGKSFYPSDVSFPIEFVVELLEHYVFEKVAAPGWQGESGWVSRLMKEIGVPVGEIVDAYRNMIESPMQRVGITDGPWSWTDENAQLHLMRATERAVAAWIDHTPGERETRTGDLSRRSLLSEYEKALRAISLCKSRLRGMSGGAAASLIQRFERLEKSVLTLT